MVAILAGRRTALPKLSVAEMAELHARCQTIAGAAACSGCLEELARSTRQRLEAELQHAWQAEHRIRELASAAETLNLRAAEANGTTPPEEDYDAWARSLARTRTPEEMDRLTDRMRGRAEQYAYATALKNVRPQPPLPARIKRRPITTVLRVGARRRQRRSTRTPVRTHRPASRKKKPRRSSDDPDLISCTIGACPDVPRVCDVRGTTRVRCPGLRVPQAHEELDHVR
jgi:hypothetical protein